MNENKAVVSALFDGLQLFTLLAADFQPRTLKQIVDLAALNGFDFSQTKVFNMLETLAAAQFLRKTDSGEWMIAPQITAISASFNEFILQRSQALLAEVAEVQSIIERKQ